MSSSKVLIKLRNDIDRVYPNSIASAGNQAVSVEEILRSVKSELAVEIDNAKGDLIDASLVRLINDVGRRKEKTSNGANTLDLFGGYKRIPQSVTIGTGKKRTLKLSIAEAESYLNVHSIRTVNEQNQELRRLILDCRKFQNSESDTLEEMLQRRAEAEEKLI